MDYDSSKVALGRRILKCGIQFLEGMKVGWVENGVVKEWGVYCIDTVQKPSEGAWLTPDVKDEVTCELILGQLNKKVSIIYQPCPGTNLKDWYVPGYGGVEGYSNRGEALVDIFEKTRVLWL
jgi:hypothetical protein